MKGLSQVELAELAGVSAYTVTEIETGRRDPHGSTLRKIAKALDVEVSDLFKEVPPPKVPAPSPEAEQGRRESSQVLREVLVDCHALLEELSQAYKEAGDVDRLVTLSNIVGFSSIGGAEVVRAEIGPREGRVNNRVYASGERLEELLDELLEYVGSAQPTDAQVFDFVEHLRRKAAG